MKVLKRIFYGVAALIIALCAVILLCAVNPKASQAVSKLLYGDGTKNGIVQNVENMNNPQAGNRVNPFAALLNRLFGRGNTTVENSNGLVGNVGENLIVTLPDEVGGLSGYQPVASVEEQITDEVAKSIKSALSAGETGSDLSFDTDIYPYYGMLNGDEQAVYNQIYANAVKLNSTFAPVKSITNVQLKNVFEAVVNDHPELFYLDTAYNTKYTTAGDVVEIRLAYYTLVNDLDSARKKFDDAADAIVAGAAALPDAYAREKYVHDALVSNVVYDVNAPLNQSAYSALVGGRTVCAGYARANQYIMQRLGIPCYYCTGYSGADHAWNIVKLSDGYYNEDVTWDDTDPSTYNYFNKTDSDFFDTHVRTGMSVNLPRCNATAFRNLESGAASTVIPETPAEPLPTTPDKPLSYDEYVSGNIEVDPSREALLRELEKLGLKEGNVKWTLEEYYEDCKVQMTVCGSGDQHFYVIVPASVFAKLETEYANNKYEEAYVNSALEILKMNRFALQIQAEKLGDGSYYKLYHNIVTWKE